LDGFEESPHKNRYLSEMKKMQKPVSVYSSSEYEKRKKCGFCNLHYPQTEVAALFTSKVLLDTYNWLSLMNHDTSFLKPPQMDINSLDYF
jgi:hypothetical protein